MDGESIADLAACRGAGAGDRPNRAVDSEAHLSPLAPDHAQSPAGGATQFSPDGAPIAPSAADLARARVMGKLVPRVPG